MGKTRILKAPIEQTLRRIEQYFRRRRAVPDDDIWNVPTPLKGIPPGDFVVPPAPVLNPGADDPAAPEPDPDPERRKPGIPAFDPETDAESERNKAPNTRDEPEYAKCERCPPRQQGHLTPQPAPQKRPEQKRGYDYQYWVCPWHYYDPARSQIGEWDWLGVIFDGLHPSECHLFEAKHGYDGFLKQDDWNAEGRPGLQDWASNAFDKIIDQADRQHAVVVSHYPNVRLTWVFSSMITKLYVFQRFIDNGWVPPIEAEVRPFEQERYDDE